MSNQKYLTKAIRLPNGKRKYIRGKTQEELNRKLFLLERELTLGVDIGNNESFKTYAERWFLTERSVGLSDGSFRNYHRFLTRHIYPYIGELKLRDIKPAHIRDIMFHASGMCRKAQGMILSILRGVLDTAVEDKIILCSPVSPKLKAKGTPTKEVPPLTPEQETALLQAAEGTLVYPFVFTLLRTGMRRGEITGLMWKDIDFDAEVIHVQRHIVSDRSGAPIIVEGAKTDAGVRDIPMPDDLKAYLKARRAQARSVYVFPNSKGKICSASALTSLWDTLDNRAGFHTHPHQLRHTYITKLFEAGLDIKQVQYVAGHSDPNITLKTYTHYRDSVRRANTIQQVKAAFCV